MKKLIILLIGIILFSNIVNAVELQKTEIYVGETAELRFIEDYIVSEDITFVLPEDFYGFNINLNEDQYELDDNILNLKNVDKEVRFEISYITTKFSYKTENVWGLSISKKDLVDVENNFISVYLPRNAKLLSANEGAEIYTLGGRIIIDFKDVEDLEISYEFSKKKEKALDYLWVFYLVVLILIFFILRRMFFKKGHKRQDDKKNTERKEDVMNILTENENKIVKILLENKRLTQKKILFLSGLPKSTLSRTLRHLQKRNVIEMRRVGISNVVYLKDWFKG